MKFTDALVEPDASWAQGRSLFGGLLSAAALRGMRRWVPARPLRSFQGAFIAPAFGEIEVDAALLRSGKHLSHAGARVGNEFSAHATFGHARGSEVVVPHALAEPMVPGAELSYVPGVTPAFTQHFRYRWTSGSFPFTANPESTFSGFCSFREAEPASDEHILALLDAWPSPVLQMLGTPTPSSTVTWNVQRTSVPIEGDASDDWWFSAHTVHAADGYAEIHGALYDRERRLVATMQQLVAVFG